MRNSSLHVLFFLACAAPAPAACQWFSSTPANPAEDAAVEGGEDAIADENSRDTSHACSSNAECDDGEPCNGEEICSIEGYCAAGVPLPDGSPCMTPQGEEGLCLYGACVAGSGCETDGECADGDVCNGDETCDTETGRCKNGIPREDGYVCNDDPRMVCIDGVCTECTGPDCPFPWWTCTSDEDCPDDGNICNGVERCDTETGECVSSGPVDDGTPCSTGPDDHPMICIAGACVANTCGDGFVWAGVEECDNESGFCSDCTLVPPPGWEECTHEDGSIAFYFRGMAPASSSWIEHRDFCRDLVEDYGPEDFDHYGLAVISSAQMWECLEPGLEYELYYAIGLRQDTTDPDYSEPDGAWYWRGFDGSSWRNVVPFDPDAAPLNHYFTGPGPDEWDCAFLTAVWEPWLIIGGPCDAGIENSAPICMIKF